MQKDIQIPVSENVYLAAIHEFNEEFASHDWNVYLINDWDQELENVLVLSHAFGTLEGEMRKTSKLRHGFPVVPVKSAVKIEFLDPKVLALNNEFMVTYFLDNRMYDKNFIFRSNTINERALSDLPAIDRRGVLVK